MKTMELCLMARAPHEAAFAGTDSVPGVRVAVLDGRQTVPTITRDLAKRVTDGGSIVVITTLRLLEEVNTALETAGFGQPRFLKTEDGSPRQPWGMGQDDTTYAVLARHKKGPFVFNERYHSGRLNGQPNDPSPAFTGNLKGAQGAVARTDVWPVGEAARIRHTVSEVFSIHTLPGDHMLLDQRLVDAMAHDTTTPMPVLFRTRPEKPVLSDEAQKRRDERDAQRAALATAQQDTKA
jgi:hypothetical protein